MSDAPPSKPPPQNRSAIQRQGTDPRISRALVEAAHASAEAARAMEQARKLDSGETEVDPAHDLDAPDNRVASPGVVARVPERAHGWALVTQTVLGVGKAIAVLCGMLATLTVLAVGLNWLIGSRSLAAEAQTGMVEIKADVKTLLPRMVKVETETAQLKESVTEIKKDVKDAATKTEAALEKNNAAMAEANKTLQSAIIELRAVKKGNRP
jgi:hypothetical protein